MADKNLKSLHPWLSEHTTPLSSGGTLHSFTSTPDGTAADAPVLCIVHGWPQSSYMWRHILPTLRQHPLFIPDLPGYGFSSLPPASDKRTFGHILLSALGSLFGADRKIIWIGHDRGARVGHRLLVDASSSPSSHGEKNIIAAILMDIVPTLAQWQAFAHPLASAAYYHWPMLALPNAAEMIGLMGGSAFCALNLRRAVGASSPGKALFEQDDAVAHYCAQFSGAECIEGSCADYAAGATVDVDEQRKDLDAGRKVEIPTLVAYSGSNLGRMHDVEKVWREWVGKGVVLEFARMRNGVGHYLPEEDPETVGKIVKEWVERFAKA